MAVWDGRQLYGVKNLDHNLAGSIGNIKGCIKNGLWSAAASARPQEAVNLAVNCLWTNQKFSSQS